MNLKLYDIIMNINSIIYMCFIGIHTHTHTHTHTHIFIGIQRRTSFVFKPRTSN